MHLSKVAVFLLASCLAASAATITYDTAPGSTTSGGAVDATATFTTGDGTLSITLTDLLANPTDVAQLISDLEFTLSNGATSGTIASSSGQEVTIDKAGNPTLGSTVDTGWTLNSTPTGLQRDVLGTPTGPSHLIIGAPDGSNVYSNANGSIAGNGPHNPFLNGSATFLLDIAGVTADTTVDSATFSFGTTEGADLVPGTPRNNPPVPEPGTYVMIAVGLGLVGLAQLRRSKVQG
jgi:PEP-CTERM motif-containing protein